MNSRKIRQKEEIMEYGTKADYIAWINKADSVDEVIEIYEASAWNDELTDDDVAEIAEVADGKIRRWQPIWNVA